MACDLNKLARDCSCEKIRTNFVEVDGVFLPEDYEAIADAVENFEVYNDDVYVCSFQKSGTTWTQEMVWCIANNLDFEKAKMPINARCPFLEFSGTIVTARAALKGSEEKSPLWITNSVEYCKQLPRPRFMKCHHPFNLLPRQIRTGERKPKVIYVARNPKDVCISYFHHSQLLEGFCGTFDEFCQLFLGDKVIYAPYWNHIRGYWEKKDQDNILFIKYEDMKKDLPSVVRRTAQFLGKNLDNTQVETLCKHLSFENMKVNPAVNRESTIEYIKSLKLFGDKSIDGEFMRSGKVGQWKASMSEEWIKKFDEWIEKNLPQCKGLTF